MGFCNILELCTRYNLSLRAQPTQSTEKPNYTPCSNEPCDTLSRLPCPLSSLSVLHVSPPVSLGSSLFSIEALLGVVVCPLIHKPFSSVLRRGCGRSLALMLDPGLCSPCLTTGQPMGCEDYAPFTGIYLSSWKEAVHYPSSVIPSWRWESSGKIGLALKSTKSFLPRNLSNSSQWTTSYSLPLPRISTHISSSPWRCSQGVLHSLGDILQDCSLQQIFWGNIVMVEHYIVLQNQHSCLGLV